MDAIVVEAQLLSDVPARPARQGLTSELTDAILTDIENNVERSKKSPFSVLEAGGGSATFLFDCRVELAFTTIDISPEQLERNTYAEDRILGDLQTYDYGERRFDLVICWDVLEHLREPEQALKRMMSAIGPGGVVLVKGPCPGSLKGLITRFTPHWFHVQYYRWILGKNTAGQPGYAPFPVELCPEADPKLIERALREGGFHIVSSRLFTTNQTERLKEKLPIVYAAYKGVAKVMETLTGGAYGSFCSDFCIVAKRQS
jgi:SAM-dependent methyltransferase